MHGDYADDYYFEPSIQRLVLKGQFDDDIHLPSARLSFMDRDSNIKGICSWLGRDGHKHTEIFYMDGTSKCLS